MLLSPLMTKPKPVIAAAVIGLVPILPSVVVTLVVVIKVSVKTVKLAAEPNIAY